MLPAASTLNIKLLTQTSMPLFCALLTISILSCNNNNSTPSQELITQLHLKQGHVISCGPPDAQFGFANSEITGDKKTKKDFNLATELLHSFEYDESEKVFAKTKMLY